ADDVLDRDPCLLRRWRIAGVVGEPADRVPFDLHVLGALPAAVGRLHAHTGREAVLDHVPLDEAAATVDLDPCPLVEERSGELDRVPDRLAAFRPRARSVVESDRIVACLLEVAALHDAALPLDEDRRTPP